MTAHNLHSNHQSAYKESFSTETALCALKDQLLWSMENGEVSVLIAPDLSAAFDTVDHEVLSAILQHNFGLQVTVLQWIQSYLKYRRLYVQVKDSVSDIKRAAALVQFGSTYMPAQ